MTSTEGDKLVYCTCMEQVKRRLHLIKGLSSRSIGTGDEAADAEFALPPAEEVP